jgi:hypothetical protein
VGNAANAAAVAKTAANQVHVDGFRSCGLLPTSTEMCHRH